MHTEAESIKPPLPKKNLRDVLFMAEQAAETGVKVLPGNSWALHYPKNGEKRAAKLQELLKGKTRPEDVAEDIKPDALIYDMSELEAKDGFQNVSARIRQATANVAYYDYRRFAELVASMKGLNVDIPTIQQIYDGIAQSRIAKEIIDRSLSTGRQQMETALRAEAASMIEDFKSQASMERVLNALKLNWLCDDMRYIRTDQRDKAIAQLTEEERPLYETLRDSYRRYVQEGEQKDYESLVGNVRKTTPRMKFEPTPEETKEPEGMSESMKDLMKEIEPFMDQADPQRRSDPGIPEEFHDTYDPRPSPTSGEETSTSRPWFEITPSGKSTAVLLGDYCSARSSYYDNSSKNWSNKTALSPYNKSASGDLRQTISATVVNPVTSIPIPNHYTLDISSLKHIGNKPEIFRDQNGCFFVKVNGSCSLKIDFLAEKPPFSNSPINDDLQPIYKGTLSTESENLITQLKGGNLDKVEQLRNYLLSHHYYPAGGDLQAAGALQLKLRGESTPDNYIQNLEKSEYLECYSANTLFIAMLRRAGIPARLVMGHKVQSANQGKAVIDANTKHAWAEVWDGIAWRRFDATPRPKPEDKKKDQDKKDQSDNTPTDEANDGGIEQPTPPPQQEQGEKQKGKKSKQKGQQMGEASDSDMKEAQSNLDEAEKTVEKMEKQKDALDKKMEKAESFKELKEMQEELEKADLLDDQKDDLQSKLEAKKSELKTDMKDELEKMLEDGFMEEDEVNKLEKELAEAEADKLDELQRRIEEENTLYNEYEDIKAEIMPQVDRWYEYFAKRLPHQLEIEDDLDTLTRQGAFNRRSVMRPRNLIFNLVKNPRVIRPNIKPLFISFTVLDVSGSMSKNNKLKMARKYLVFKNELFSKIGKEFGYIRWADYIFSDSVSEIKTCAQEYDSPQRYRYQDGSNMTVKARLMKAIQAGGGTNMLDAIKRASSDLNEETYDYPDYASALYFIGDGEDTCGNEANIKKFLEIKDAEHGFGKHMLAAIMLGDERVRAKLAEIFGDEHTTVADDFDELIEKNMLKFDEDIEVYLKGKTTTA